MGFRREKEQLAGHIQQLCGIECGQSLGIGDPVIVLSVNDQNGRIPVPHKMMGRAGVGPHGHHVFRLPGSASLFPVVEEHLVGGHVFHFGVEHPAVGDKSFEPPLVVPCQPENGKAPEAGPDGSQSLLVDEGLFFHHVDGPEQILHGLAGVVPADLIGPLLSHGGHPAPVGCHNDVSVGSHLAEVPPVAPELAQGRLGPSLAVEQGGIFPGAVEMRGIDDPGEHLLIVRGGDPSLFHRGHGQLVQDMFVLEGDLGGLARDGFHAVNLLWFGHIHAGGDQPVPGHSHRMVVMVARSDRRKDQVGYIHFVDLEGGHHPGHKIEDVFLFPPGQARRTVVKIGGEIVHLPAFKIHPEEPFLVRFKSRPFHAQPVQLLSIRGK